MIIGVAASGQTPFVAQLRHHVGVAHRPEVRIGERNIYSVKLQCMVQLTPVVSDHIRRDRHARGATEFRKRFSA